MARSRGYGNVSSSGPRFIVEGACTQTLRITVTSKRINLDAAETSGLTSLGTHENVS
jgi:hypothetical protein